MTSGKSCSVSSSNTCQEDEFIFHIPLNSLLSPRVPETSSIAENQNLDQSEWTCTLHVSSGLEESTFVIPVPKSNDVENHFSSVATSNYHHKNALTTTAVNDKFFTGVLGTTKSTHVHKVFVDSSIQCDHDCLPLATQFEHYTFSDPEEAQSCSKQHLKNSCERWKNMTRKFPHKESLTTPLNKNTASVPPLFPQHEKMVCTEQVPSNGKYCKSSWKSSCKKQIFTSSSGRIRKSTVSNCRSCPYLSSWHGINRIKKEIIRISSAHQRKEDTALGNITSKFRTFEQLGVRESLDKMIHWVSQCIDQVVDAATDAAAASGDAAHQSLRCQADRKMSCLLLPERLGAADTPLPEPLEMPHSKQPLRDHGQAARLLMKELAGGHTPLSPNSTAAALGMMQVLTVNMLTEIVHERPSRRPSNSKRSHAAASAEHVQRGSSRCGDGQFMPPDSHRWSSRATGSHSERLRSPQPCPRKSRDARRATRLSSPKSPASQSSGNRRMGYAKPQSPPQSLGKNTTGGATNTLNAEYHQHTNSKPSSPTAVCHESIIATTVWRPGRQGENVTAASIREYSFLHTTAEVSGGGIKVSECRGHQAMQNLFRGPQSGTAKRKKKSHRSHSASAATRVRLLSSASRGPKIATKSEMVSKVKPTPDPSKDRTFSRPRTEKPDQPRGRAGVKPVPELSPSLMQALYVSLKVPGARRHQRHGHGCKSSAQCVTSCWNGHEQPAEFPVHKVRKKKARNVSPATSEEPVPHLKSRPSPARRPKSLGAPVVSRMKPHRTPSSAQSSVCKQVSQTQAMKPTKAPHPKDAERLSPSSLHQAQESGSTQRPTSEEQSEAKSREQSPTFQPTSTQDTASNTLHPLFRHFLFSSTKQAQNTPASEFNNGRLMKCKQLYKKDYIKKSLLLHRSIRMCKVTKIGNRYSGRQLRAALEYTAYVFRTSRMKMEEMVLRGISMEVRSLEKHRSQAARFHAPRLLAGQHLREMGDSLQRPERKLKATATTAFTVTSDSDSTITPTTTSATTTIAATAALLSCAGSVCDSPRTKQRLEVHIPSGFGRRILRKEISPFPLQRRYCCRAAESRKEKTPMKDTRKTKRRRRRTFRRKRKKAHLHRFICSHNQKKRKKKRKRVLNTKNTKHKHKRLSRTCGRAKSTMHRNKLVPVQRHIMPISQNERHENPFRSTLQVSSLPERPCCKQDEDAQSEISRKRRRLDRNVWCQGYRPVLDVETDTESVSVSETECLRLCCYLATTSMDDELSIISDSSDILEELSGSDQESGSSAEAPFSNYPEMEPFIANMIEHLHNIQITSPPPEFLDFMAKSPVGIDKEGISATQQESERISTADKINNSGFDALESVMHTHEMSVLEEDTLPDSERLLPCPIDPPPEFADQPPCSDSDSLSGPLTPQCLTHFSSSPLEIASKMLPSKLYSVADSHKMNNDDCIEPLPFLSDTTDLSVNYPEFSIGVSVLSDRGGFYSSQPDFEDLTDDLDVSILGISDITGFSPPSSDNGGLLNLVCTRPHSSHGASGDFQRSMQNTLHSNHCLGGPSGKMNEGLYQTKTCDHSDDSSSTQAWILDSEAQDMEDCTSASELQSTGRTLSPVLVAVIAPASDLNPDPDPYTDLDPEPYFDHDLNPYIDLDSDPYTDLNPELASASPPALDLVPDPNHAPAFFPDSDTDSNTDHDSVLDPDSDADSVANPSNDPDSDANSNSALNTNLDPAPPSPCVSLRLDNIEECSDSLAEQTIGNKSRYSEAAMLPAAPSSPPSHCASGLSPPVPKRARVPSRSASSANQRSTAARWGSARSQQQLSRTVCSFSRAEFNSVSLWSLETQLWQRRWRRQRRRLVSPSTLAVVAVASPVSSPGPSSTSAGREPCDSESSLDDISSIPCDDTSELLVGYSKFCTGLYFNVGERGHRSMAAGPSSKLPVTPIAVPGPPLAPAPSLAHAPTPAPTPVTDAAHALICACLSIVALVGCLAFAIPEYVIWPWS